LEISLAMKSQIPATEKKYFESIHHHHRPQDITGARREGHLTRVNQSQTAIGIIREGV
jgi:hypothetical protein